METKIVTHITKGVLIALAIIIINIAGQLLHVSLETWFSWIGIVVFCGGIIWAVMYYGQQLNHNVTFGNLFAHGFKVTAVVTCITFIYTLLSVYVLFPGFIDEVVQKGLDEARKQGKVSEEQLSQGMDMIKKITTISLLAGALLGSLIIGAIASLIGAAITKKRPQDPFVQEPQM